MPSMFKRCKKMFQLLRIVAIFSLLSQNINCEQNNDQQPQIVFERVDMPPEFLFDFPKRSPSEGPTKPKEKTYEEVFGNPHKEKKVPKQRELPRRPQKKDTTEPDPFKFGLPGIVIVSIQDEYIEGIDKDPSIGESVCNRLSFGIMRNLDIETREAHWMPAQGNCLFQIPPDENIDDVQDWLSEQDIVKTIAGSSPVEDAVKRAKARAQHKDQAAAEKLQEKMSKKSKH